ncbi:hypothetical protein EDD16DRAFT_84143 [Pisolithus croceorrhizus]|nr:hypothetical protein EDD16DRAFT_84143 [Pisolithus croceorrhizus]
MGPRKRRCLSRTIRGSLCERTRFGRRIPNRYLPLHKRAGTLYTRNPSSRWVILEMGPQVQDEDLRMAFLPSLASGTRSIDQVQSYTPTLNYMSDG